MGVAYMSKKKVDLAADHFRKALALDPRHVFALADMADVMLIRKSYGEALAFAQRATAESPPFYQPYLSMANVLLAMKKDREAEEFYARARAHGMPGYLVPFAKARIYYLQGDTAQAARYLSEVQKMRGSPDMKEGTEAPKMPR
jgi:tetratricopeptide (TPR) repeat protein